MSVKDIDRIVENLVFTMKVEGFVTTEEQENDWRKVLEGEKDLDALIDQYKLKAQSYGAATNA